MTMDLREKYGKLAPKPPGLPAAPRDGGDVADSRNTNLNGTIKNTKPIIRDGKKFQGNETEFYDQFLLDMNYGSTCLRTSNDVLMPSQIMMMMADVKPFVANSQSFHRRAQSFHPNDQQHRDVSPGPQPSLKTSKSWVHPEREESGKGITGRLAIDDLDDEVCNKIESVLAINNNEMKRPNFDNVDLAPILLTVQKQMEAAYKQSRRQQDKNSDDEDNDEDTSDEESGSDYSDDSDSMEDGKHQRRRRRVPKFVKPNISAEPRPLMQLPEEAPIANWPPFIRPKCDPPSLVCPPPSYRENFSQRYNVPIKPFDNKKTTKEPEVVYDADRTQPNSLDFILQRPPTPSPNPTVSKFGDQLLTFESRFECGNLLKALHLDSCHYELQVRKDWNTAGHTQWYYFRVTGMVAGVPYRFDISNLMKKDSLYNYGLRPLVYSENAASSKGVGWHRAGENIIYFKNPTDPAAEEEDPNTRPSYTLSFTVVFESEDDTVFFAHCYPFSYSDLQAEITALKEDPFRSTLFRHTVLCKSLGGNNIDLITITTPVQTPDDLKRRKGIIISARVHPGETNSSWMMKGLIHYLTSDSREAQFLRDQFVIKIVPMLNPDGVIVGNYRCNLKGYDLNRKWSVADTEWAKTRVPEICGMRDLLTRSSETREIVFFCDLHGHNRKNGIFMYGCHSNETSTNRPVNNNKPRLLEETLSTFRERVFPYMLSKLSPDLFFFRRCQFKMQKSKEGTGRITVRKVYGILNSFTLEASFCGSDTPYGGFHYSTSDLERMGETLGKTLFEYFSSGGKVATEVHTKLQKLFDEKDPNIEPEESASSDTTSDDEKLRIKPKATRKKLTKRRNRPSVTKVQPAPDMSDPFQSGNAVKVSKIKIVPRVNPAERRPSSAGKETVKMSSIKISSQPIQAENIGSARRRSKTMAAIEYTDQRKKYDPPPPPKKNMNKVVLELSTQQASENMSKRNEETTIIGPVVDELPMFADDFPPPNSVSQLSYGITLRQITNSKNQNPILLSTSRADYLANNHNKVSRLVTIDQQEGNLSQRQKALFPKPFGKHTPIGAGSILDDDHDLPLPSGVSSSVGRLQKLNGGGGAGFGGSQSKLAMLKYARAEALMMGLVQNAADAANATLSRSQQLGIGRRGSLRRAPLSSSVELLNHSK
ncbi:Cytosolic carboxypeptidase 2 [Blyttiomyces sp. JEL0837]|nr:Cytosolic carboxypeptidase 2 [Blyttiomyces sp. JEL0837]